MNKVCSFLCLPLLLVGCVSQEDKIVDLSGIIFLMFIGLLVLKFLAIRMTRHPLFEKISRFFSRHTIKIVSILVILSTALMGMGVYLSGIHRVLILIGMVVATLAYLVYYAQQAADLDRKKLMIESIPLSLSFAVVLFILWYLGGDLFRSL